MKTMKTVIKKIILNTVPDKMLQIIKKFYYYYQLKSPSEKQEIEFNVIKHLINSGDNVVDIGAHIGIYTKYFSQLVGIRGKVYSIEPIPLTFEILRSNVLKLRLENVEAINAAVSDNNGSVTMEVPLYKTGGENFYRAHISSEKSEKSLRHVRVESKTIDSLFSKLSYNISFMKCDVEGHELSCLKGGIDLIRHAKPASLIEISQDPDDIKSTAYETFKLLYEVGYGAFWYDGTKLARRRPGDKSVNYFFLAPNHLEALQKQNFPISDTP